MLSIHTPEEYKMEDKKNIQLSCLDCHAYHCHYQDSRYPDFCLTSNINPDTYKRAMDFLNSPEDNRIAVAAAQVEYEGYGKRTRVEEVIQFARKIGAKKLGIATCLGLIEESRTLTKILRNNGFEVYGVVCKCGATPKVDIGIPSECEAVGVNMCNPILQAELLNDANTDLNLIMGLCVGHDSLFIKHSNALCTSVVTKDRVLAHNPAAALYTSNMYYSRLFDEQP